MYNGARGPVNSTVSCIQKSKIKKGKINMPEIKVLIDIHFDESDGKYYAEGKLNGLTPLADGNISSFQERLEKSLEMLQREDMGPKKYRLEALSKIYGDYLMADKIASITPFHHQIQFTCGSGGVEFARDFCFMLYAFGVSKVHATISSYDSDHNILFELNTDELWNKERKGS
jgi:hypothetical protein